MPKGVKPEWLRDYQFKPGPDPRRHAGKARKTYSVKELFKLVADEADGDRTRLEGIIRNIFEEAAGGEQWACQMVVERLGGKVRESMDVNVNVPILPEILAKIRAKLDREGAHYAIPEHTDEV